MQRPSIGALKLPRLRAGETAQPALSRLLQSRGRPRPLPGADNTVPAEGEDDITRIKRQARAHERENDKLRKQLADMQAAAQSEQDKALTAARDEGRADAFTQFKGKLVGAEALRAMAGKVTNPKLALPHLDLDGIEVAGDGTIDEAALTAAVDDLLATYPELAAVPAIHHADLGPRRPAAATRDDPNDLLRAFARGPVTTRKGRPPCQARRRSQGMRPPRSSRSSGRPT